MATLKFIGGKNVMMGEILKTVIVIVHVHDVVMVSSMKQPAKNAMMAMTSTVTNAAIAVAKIFVGTAVEMSVSNVIRWRVCVGTIVLYRAVMASWMKMLVKNAMTETISMTTHAVTLVSKIFVATGVATLVSNATPEAPRARYV